MKLFFTLLPILFFFSLQAKEAPNFTLICPANVTVNCYAEIWDLSIYGNAQYHDYYGYHSAGTPVVHYYLNSCGTGYITRTWTVEDPYWNQHSCTQTITVRSLNVFNYYSITWPQPYTTLSGCSPNISPDVTGKPYWINEECSLIAWSYRDQVFTTNDACKKILRKWTLIDWCSYTGYGNIGEWTYTQVIKIVNNDKPEIRCIPDITVTSYNCKNAWVTAPPITVWNGNCNSGVIITNNSPYSISKGADISGQYPVGVTKVLITVKYGCGGISQCLVKVTVANNKPPTPICHSLIAIPLSGKDTNGDGINDKGSVELWAKDINFKSESTCGFNPLKFSFTIDPKDASRTFTCDDVGKNEVKMYVIDSRGNYDFCVVTIDIQNNAANISNCEPEPDPTSMYSVSGRLIGIYNDVKPNKTVMLYDPEVTSVIDTNVTVSYITRLDSFINFSGVKLYFYEADTIYTTSYDTLSSLGERLMTITNSSGKFLFDKSMVFSSTRILKVAALETTLEKIDRFDIDMLTSYLIDPTTFTQPYQYIAADVNRDKLVDIQDLNLLIAYLSGDIQNFGQESWFAVYANSLQNGNASVVLNNAKFEAKIENIASDKTDMNFQLVQLGDISTFTDEDSQYASEESELRDRSINTDTDLVVGPNPFKNEFVFMLTANQSGNAIIQIVDAAGSKVYENSHAVNKGMNAITITGDAFPLGMLFYDVVIDGKNYHGKLLKIN